MPPFSEATRQDPPARLGVPGLARVTTRYSPAQDRVGLAGALPDGSPLLLWLTQRLLRRMLPPLTAWLEGRGARPEQTGSVADESAVQALYADALQGFAQEAAQAHLMPQAPVQVPENAPACLVQVVDVVVTPQALRLVFGDAQGAVATMELQAQPLRQWLGILYNAWCQADWPTDLWPVWLQESPLARQAPAPAVVH